MAHQYPNGGIFFENRQKRNDRAPDYQGTLDIGEDTIRYLVTEIKAGRDPKLSISGWNKVSGKGNAFISMKVEKPREEQQRQPPPPAPPRPAPRQSPRDLDDDIPF